MFADDILLTCSCGAKIYVEMRWGKIASVQLVPTIREEYKWDDGTSKQRVSSIVGKSSDEARVGNVKYWKDHHGNNWLQAHDDFERQHAAWWAKHKNA